MEWANVTPNSRVCPPGFAHLIIIAYYIAQLGNTCRIHSRPCLQHVVAYHRQLNDYMRHARHANPAHMCACVCASHGAPRKQLIPVELCDYFDVARGRGENLILMHLIKENIVRVVMSDYAKYAHALADAMNLIHGDFWEHVVLVRNAHKLIATS